MTLDISMSKLLQSYGAKESTRFRTKESRFANLLQLVREAERCVEELTTCVLSAAAGGSLSIALVKEKEKQLALWKRRQKLLSRMKSGFERITIPGPPSSVTLEVVGTKTLRVKFAEPENASDPETVVTKYKVEWSVRENFVQLSGSREIMNLLRLEMQISELTHGVPYYVRVAAGNLKGYGPYATSSPLFAVPSSWMDVDGKRSRSLGRLCQLDCIFHQIIFSRPPCSSEIKDLVFSHTLETPQQQRRQHVRKSIKNLFTSTPKFHKVMKSRGIYLATLLYSDRRVLVTADDTLPLMEIEENCPSNIHNDFHWLMKVACTWEDAKALRAEMEKSHSSSAVHFRSKLLQAAEMMQAALGIQDLGQFYYKPLKDVDDTTVLCTVKYVPDTKSLTNLSVRWMPLTKLHRKLSINSISSAQDVLTVNSTLLSSTQSMMTYNQVSRLALPRGLYLAYVKISSSVDLIRVLVPKKAPNVLPYYRIRENPHVSCEEWSWIKQLKNEHKLESATECQLKFQRSLSSAARSLLSLLDVSPDQAAVQRLYDAEVVELNSDVSLILMLPPVESFCSVPGQKDVAERDDCIRLPVQIFEMIHMNTYQPLFISRYSRISSILEMDTIVANHFHREAFSSSELSSAKSRLRQLQQFQNQVDNTWRSMRWLMDVLNFAREKQPCLGIPLENLLLDAPGDESPCLSESPSPQQSPPLRHTLQVPCNVSGMKGSFDNKGEGELITIKITSSGSSYSLVESGSTDFLTEGRTMNEMRRCASTSGLIQVSKGGDSDDDQSASSSCLSTTNMETKAMETLEVESQLENAETTSSDCLECVVEDGKGDDARQADDESLLSEYGIVMNPVECRGVVPEIKVPEESSASGDEETPTNAEDCRRISLEGASDESTEDEGLLFRAIPEADDDLLEGEEAEFFFAGESETEEGESSPQEDISTEPNFLKVFVERSEPELEVSVNLQVDPQICVREIIEEVVSQAQLCESGSAPEEGKFYLVACRNAKEKVLPDNFQPFSVQNPWTKGKIVLKERP